MSSFPRETSRDLGDRRLCVAVPQRQIDYITIACERAHLCEFRRQNNFSPSLLAG